MLSLGVNTSDAIKIASGDVSFIGVTTGVNVSSTGIMLTIFFGLPYFFLIISIEVSFIFLGLPCLNSVALTS